MNAANLQMKAKIDSFTKRVLEASSNEYTLQQARELVPISSIVQENLDILDGDYKDNLLPHIVSWFSEFFRWFNPPDCESCDISLEYHGSLINIEGNQVEIYKCIEDSCNSRYDFIRHGDPAILLQTRQGRCGEWADCFFVILKALDYDARIVLDTTDHVWNEVWSEAKDRWVHVDPCESTIDTPLLYEVGWGKELQYCLAFSPSEVQDVTPRYCVNYMNTLTRRNSCDEAWLSSYLDEVTSRLSNSNEFEKIRLRRIKERTWLNLISSKPRSVSEYGQVRGRQTGSIEWRQRRGEFSPIIKTQVKIKVEKTTNSISGEPFFFLKYNCDRNRYISSTDTYTAKVWSSLIYESENLDYKFERDWKTSYIARYETCPYDKIGKVCWMFDISAISNCDEWKYLEILLNGQIYPGTSIILQLVSMNENEEVLNRLDIELNSFNRFDSDMLLKNNCRFLGVEAQLQGGEATDNVAWQKPQLFRQVRGQSTRNEWPLLVQFF